MVSNDSMAEDRILLERYVAHQSEEAFALLVHRYLGIVYSAANRQLGGDIHGAQDVAQMVFTEFARQASKLQYHPTLAGWLYTTTRHVAIHVMRDQGRRRRREQEAQAMHKLEHETAPEWERLGPVLDEAMQDLREKDRCAVLLRYFDGRDLRSVGRALGVGEDAARMRVDRALDRLRLALNKRGITATTTALAAVLPAHAAELVPAGLAGGVISSAVGAAATASTASVLPIFVQVQTSLVIMKTPVIVASIAAALMAVPLIYRQHLLETTETEVAQLREQKSTDRGVAPAAGAAAIEELLGDKAELGNLRAEAARLRPVANSPLQGQLAAARSQARAAEAALAAVQAEAEFRRVRELHVEAAKLLGLAAQLFAGDHGDTFPTSLEEIAEFTGKLGVPAEVFEFYPQPRAITEREGGLFVLRERIPRRRSDGKWERIYCLADGSAQTLTSDTADFTEVESKSYGIANAELPPASRRSGTPVRQN